jgi:glycolate oxidase FAD binding subunit
MKEQDINIPLQERIKAAIADNTPLCIRGGNSKAFYGREAVGEPLEVGAHCGIVNYEPTELVITARAGTPLRVIEDTLAQHKQMLAFEPPHYGDTATLGGTIACNLSGPRRAYGGAARDFVLGSKLLSGRGEILSFGGEVMKNVAGYDASRLMAGALGTLGVLLEISLKVLPRPEQELTLRLANVSPNPALQQMHAWAQQPLPLSATAYCGGALYVRLSGTPDAVTAAAHKIGGDSLDASEADLFWQELREQRHAFYDDPRPLWRLSLASDRAPLALAGNRIYEWGGALRWLISDEAPQRIRDAAKQAGGHATLYRNGINRHEVFQPLSPKLMTLHRRLKQAFDPHGILNPGRLYADL